MMLSRLFVVRRCGTVGIMWACAVPAESYYCRACGGEMRVRGVVFAIFGLS
jgi:late competence protein required for DNA uptake (superfamily II DNA/RNA helicase)